jgi:cytoskeletal protein CcmA (bactofilin family)
MANEASSELSLVGAGTVIEGKIRTEGSIRVDGKLHGDLLAKVNIAVGEHGVIEGNVSARNVSLAGKVSGTVTATEKLVLEGRSVMKGDIRATRLVVDEGAMFDGHCAMTTQGGPQR